MNNRTNNAGSFYQAKLISGACPALGLRRQADNNEPWVRDAEVALHDTMDAKIAKVVACKRILLFREMSQELDLSASPPLICFRVAASLQGVQRSP